MTSRQAARARKLLRKWIGIAEGMIEAGEELERVTRDLGHCLPDERERLEHWVKLLRATSLPRGAFDREKALIARFN